MADCKTIERCKLVCSDAFVVSTNAINCFRFGDGDVFGTPCTVDEMSVLFVHDPFVTRLDESCWPPPPPSLPSSPSPPPSQPAPPPAPPASNAPRTVLLVMGNITIALTTLIICCWALSLVRSRFFDTKLRIGPNIV